MVTVRQVIEQAYTKVNGEYELLAETSDDFKTYLTVLNSTMQVWAETPYVKWQSLYKMDYTLPVKVAEGVLAYTLPDYERIDLANTPYDSIYFVDDSGKTVATYKLVNQATFDSTSQSRVCALLGGKLHLKSTEDAIVGTSIRLPVYLRPLPYVSGQETVKIDSITWLVTYMAATLCDASPVPFIARNADKYYEQAKIPMKNMRDNNRRKQRLVIKSLNSIRGAKWEDVLSVMTMKDL